jgi:hypothetical protein
LRRHVGMSVVFGGKNPRHDADISSKVVPRVCRKWGIQFSLVKARTEILEILLW